MEENGNTNFFFPLFILAICLLSFLRKRKKREEMPLEKRATPSAPTSASAPQLPPTQKRVERKRPSQAVASSTFCKRKRRRRIVKLVQSLPSKKALIPLAELLHRKEF